MEPEKGPGAQPDAEPGTKPHADESYMEVYILWDVAPPTTVSCIQEDMQ